LPKEEEPSLIDLSRIDYSALDRLEPVRYLFYPRPDYSPQRTESEHVLIPVEQDVAIDSAFYIWDNAAPIILFFHGNGEIVSDYDQVSELYARAGLNFIIADYRGYGRSTGTPSITGMMRDCHTIYEFVRSRLRDKGCSGPFIVMGRSLGSASALEILAGHGDTVDGLIIESGFAQTQTLLDLIGIKMKNVNLTEEDGFRNLDKIRTFGKPTLIIHAEHDHLLPFSEGQLLYESSPAQEKKLLKIAGADHNDILERDTESYMKAIRSLADLTVSRSHEDHPEGNGSCPE
jgi:hypothetical protein